MERGRSKLASRLTLHSSSTHNMARIDDGMVWTGQLCLRHGIRPLASAQEAPSSTYKAQYPRGMDETYYDNIMPPPRTDSPRQDRGISYSSAAAGTNERLPRFTRSTSPTRALEPPDHPSHRQHSPWRPPAREPTPHFYSLQDGVTISNQPTRR